MESLTTLYRKYSEVRRKEDKLGTYFENAKVFVCTKNYHLEQHSN